MAETLAAPVAGLVLVGILAATGRLGFVREEMPTPLRRAAGLVLLWAVLVVCVVYPGLAPGDAADIDPAHLWFPTIFAAHVVLATFLAVWWLLAWRMPLGRFLRLEGIIPADVRYGVRIGIAGWLLAITASAVVAFALLAIGYFSGGAEEAGRQALEIPPVLLWLADLPVWRKLLVVVVAMTVEEGFYRAFLQTRIGWIPSSILFALSHGGYGLPNLTASVFVVSLAIGWAFRQRGNLLPCIVAHGLFDAVQLLVIMPLAVDHLRQLG